MGDGEWDVKLAAVAPWREAGEPLETGWLQRPTVRYVHGQRIIFLESAGHLTYMSIGIEISNRVAENRLILVRAKIESTISHRTIYAAPLLHRPLWGPWNDQEEEQRMGRLHADLDFFSSGGLITVTTGSHKYAYMKKLDNLDEEVWEIRSRDPKLSLRVFGRFAETDTFVATHACDRAYLGAPKSKEWRDEFERCKVEWRKLFPSYNPLKGNNVYDYISADVVDLGSIR